METVKARAGDTLEQLVYRALGRQDDEALTAVLDVNSGLADHGLVLPAGLVVNLPDMAEEPAVTQLKRLQELWD